MKMLEKSTSPNFRALRPFCAVLILTITLASAATAQQLNPARDGRGPVFTVVDQPPQFPGGEDSLKSYFEKKLGDLKGTRKKNKSQTVSTTFIVSETGAIENVRILKSGDKSLNAEAVRVIENMPAWIPGKQSGIPVAVHYTLPVPFPEVVD